MMKLELNKLSKKDLQEIILKMENCLSEEQKQKLYEFVQEHNKICTKEDNVPMQMSQEFVDEKMQQIEKWQQQIDDGKIYLDVEEYEEYEDYSEGYWEPDLIIEYYDNQEIGDKIMSMINFAKDCVNDRHYPEAGTIYKWLWEMSVCTYLEYDEESDAVDLEILEENNIINTDIKQLALLTLYTEYQNVDKQERAEALYYYFSYYTFRKLHIEDMFYIGRETLKDSEQFWEDWINLLKTKKGNKAANLLKEAILYCDGIENLLKMADENVSIHPSLYLAVIAEYDAKHMYAEMEKAAEKALEKIDKNLVIRGEIALKAATVSDYLQHKENVMRFCWECFRSNSTVRNYLRLFITEEMAQKYGVQGAKSIINSIKHNNKYYEENSELRQNILRDAEYYTLNFYMGNFETMKKMSQNPSGSLGWSYSYIRIGIRLFLLYLYENPVLSKAGAVTEAYIRFEDSKELENMLFFERDIIQESHEHKVSMFWNCFQRWKKYFPMEQAEKKKYLDWAEKIVYSRADAIVSGQHRCQYAEVAVLLAMVGEVKECMGIAGAKKEIFAEYKSKFPRHSSFQAEMKTYFIE